MKPHELKNIIQKLKDSQRSSTPVNNWYAHSNEVRGPYNRWFTCSEVDLAYKSNVASTKKDCEYAANAMNYLPIIIEEYEKVKKELDELKVENILLGVE